jgi:hypothetical protein
VIEHHVCMTGAGTPPFCSCGWMNRSQTGPILADHLREMEQFKEIVTRIDEAISANEDGGEYSWKNSEVVALLRHVREPLKP